MMEIVAGLNQSSVQLLNTIFDEMPSKYKNYWKTITDFIDPVMNFRNYRTRLELKLKDKDPVIPFLCEILFNEKKTFLISSSHSSFQHLLEEMLCSARKEIAIY